MFEHNVGTGDGQILILEHSPEKSNLVVLILCTKEVLEHKGQVLFHLMVSMVFQTFNHQC